jgi:hypothetical protein
MGPIQGRGLLGKRSGPAGPSEGTPSPGSGWQTVGHVQRSGAEWLRSHLTRRTTLWSRRITVRKE